MKNLLTKWSPSSTLQHFEYAQLSYSFLSRKGIDSKDEHISSNLRAILSTIDKQKPTSSANQSLVFFPNSQKPIIHIFNLTILLGSIHHHQTMSNFPKSNPINWIREKLSLHEMKMMSQHLMREIGDKYFDIENPRLLSELERNVRMIQTTYQSGGQFF